MTCEKCGNNVSDTYMSTPRICKDCFSKLSPVEQERAKGASIPQSQTTHNVIRYPGETAISALKFFAWLDLIGGIVGAIWVWAEFGSTQVSSFYSSTTEANPMAIGIGAVVLLQGMFACALFLVIACIAESLIAIRKNKLLSIE